MHYARCSAGYIETALVQYIDREISVTSVLFAIADKTVYRRPLSLRKRQTSSVCSTLECVYYTHEPAPKSGCVCVQYVSVDLHQYHSAFLSRQSSTKLLAVVSLLLSVP